MFCAPELIFGGTEGVRSRFYVLRARTCYRWCRRRHVLFSCFALPDSFSAVPIASGPVFLFCAPGLVFGSTEGIGSRFHVFRSRTYFRRYLGALGPIFMFCAPRLVFGGTGGVRSRFLVLRAKTHFRRYSGRLVPFSCFARPDSFSAAPRASGPVFMFCAPRLVFDGTKGVGSSFHVLRSLIHFRRYRGRRIPFSCFALLDSFSALPRASFPVFTFCAPGLVFDGSEGIESRFHVLRCRTHFRRYRGRRVPFPSFPFSCFALPYSFSTVPSAAVLIFSFSCFVRPDSFSAAPEGVRSRFHVLRSQTRFRRYHGCRVRFSCFALPDSFSAVPRASNLVFMFCVPRLFSAVPRASAPVLLFCAPGLVFGGTEGIGSRFHVLRSRTHFRRYRGRRVPFSSFVRQDSFSAVPRASGPVFMFCAPGLVFGGTKGFGSHFHVLHFRTCFRRYRGRPFPFSCFPFPGMFLAVRWVSGPVFMFFAPRHIFGGTEGVGSYFHVLRSRTQFSVVPGRRVPFSYFALPNSFSAVPRASGPFSKFFAPGLVFGGTGGVGSHFLVLRSHTHFQRYCGRRVPFSCFALPDSFLAAPRASCPVFMFCAPRLVFDGTEGVESRFHVLRARIRFRRYRGCRVLFSRFALPGSFSAVPRASGPVFLFCAPGLVFGGTEGVGSRFQVLHTRTHFRRYWGRTVLFSYF
jgi:hypothetical protein